MKTLLSLSLLSFSLLFSNVSSAVYASCTVYGQSGALAQVEWKFSPPVHQHPQYGISLSLESTAAADYTTSFWIPSFGNPNAIRLYYTAASDGSGTEQYMDLSLKDAGDFYTGNLPDFDGYVTRANVTIEAQGSASGYWGVNPLQGAYASLFVGGQTQTGTLVGGSLDGLYAPLNSYWILPDTIDFGPAGPGVTSTVNIPKSTRFKGTYSVSLDADSVAGSTISSPSGRIGPGETMTADNVDTDQLLELTRGDAPGAIKGTARFTLHCG